MQQRTCAECSTQFEGHPNAKYCTPACKSRSNNRHALCLCRHCGQQFRPPSRTYYCSDTCRAEGGRPRLPSTLTCQHCGNQFARTAKRPRKYCGPTCLAAVMNKRPHGQHHARKVRYRDSHLASKRRRRATERGSACSESIVPARIYARDGWRCGICHRKVNPLLTYPHPRSASLDHIEPLSLGGHHVPANVQLAHLDCNVDKNNRKPAQLRLFG